MGLGRFANVSAISGFDFDDDGRGLAVVDWDHDGDLDVWLRNRNGPRLRFLRNHTVRGNGSSSSHSVSLQLRGKFVNRDAIGARVEILRADPAVLPLVQTVYAGDAFLSQSSKELIFGLGDDTPIDSVVVHWPGGAVEEFSGVEVNGRFRLARDNIPSGAIGNAASCSCCGSEHCRGLAGSNGSCPAFCAGPTAAT